MRLLQQILGIEETETFDDNTLKAVKDFQRAHFPSEEPKGGVGPLTWQELDKVYLTPAADAYQGIEIYPVVQDVLPDAPGGSPNAMKVTAPDGSYALHANVNRAGRIVYYLAYSSKRKRVEFAVGPSQVGVFVKRCEAPRISKFNLWEIAAGNYFGLSGNSTEWQRLSAQAVSCAMRGDFAGYWRAWGKAQIAAFKDPAWWLYLLGGASAMSAPEVDAAAASARADAEAAAVDADSAAAEAKPSGTTTPKPSEAPAPAPVTGSVEELNTVKAHLSSLPDGNALVDFPPNQAMVDRIANAQATGRALTEGETNFLKHELTEAKLVKEGMPQEQAHEAAMKTHPPFKNYDPEVIKQYPELFNSNWRRAWGLE